MEMEAGYMLAFTTGLLGGFGHCIGMCGPIVGAYAFGVRPAAGFASISAVIPHLLYNTGRIITYACIGGIMGLTGTFVNMAARAGGIQNMVAIIAGVMMLVTGMNITGLWGSSRWLEQHNAGILARAGRILAAKSPARFITLGLILGLLPCGLSYSVFMASAGSGCAFSGMMTALMFGLGTVPALAVFGSAVTSLGASLRGRIYRGAGAVVIATGVYFLFKGIRSYAGL